MNLDNLRIRARFEYIRHPSDPYIENLIRQYLAEPTLLNDGRAPKEFPLRPREILANWLLCIPRFHDLNHECVMVADLTKGEAGFDGGIIDLTKGEIFAFQHVYIPTREIPDGSVRDMQNLYVEKIQKKAGKGAAYADGSDLVIFSDAVGLVTPLEIGKVIKDSHKFKSILAFGLQNKNQHTHNYFLTVLDSPRNYFTYRISVPENCKFNECKIEKTY